MELILISPTVNNRRVVVSQWKDGRFCLSVQTYHKNNWAKRTFKNKESYVGYSLEKAIQIFENLSGYKASVGQMIVKMRKRNERNSKNIQNTRVK